MSQSVEPENPRQLSGQLLLLAWFALAIVLREGWFETLPSVGSISAHVSQVGKFFR